MHRLRRSARWRQEPATEPQRKFVLSKWSQKISPELSQDAKKDLLYDMTKGNIAEIITRLRNGSMVIQAHSTTRRNSNGSDLILVSVAEAVGDIGEKGGKREEGTGSTLSRES